MRSSDFWSRLWYVSMAMAVAWSLLCLVLLAFMSCDRPSPEIRMGIVEQSTGNSLAVDGSVTNAVRLAIQHLEAGGGLWLGGRRYQVKLSIQDDRGSVEQAIAAVRRLIYQQNVIAIIGPQRSLQVIPAAQFAEDAAIPLISPSATHPAVTAGRRYIFRAGFTDDWQGRVLADFAYHSLGARRAAMLYDTASDYPRTLAEVFGQFFAAAGGEIVAATGYTSDVTDYASQLEYIYDSRPDLLFLPNYPDEVIKQVRQARRLGIAAPFLGADAWNSIDFQSLPELEGSYFSTHWYPENPDSASQQFVRAYRQTYQQLPNADAALAYDAAGLLLQVLQEQGRPDAGAVRDGLAAMPIYHGITGNIRYQGSGDPLKPLFIMKIHDAKPVFDRRIDP